MTYTPYNFRPYKYRDLRVGDVYRRGNELLTIKEAPRLRYLWARRSFWCVTCSTVLSNGDHLDQIIHCASLVDGTGHFKKVSS